MSDFRVRKIVIHDGSPARGYLAIVTLDFAWGIYAMQFRGMRIIKRKDSDGLMLAMPSRKNSSGNHIEMVRPVNPETTAMLEDAVIGEYNRLKDQGRFKE